MDGTSKELGMNLIETDLLTPEIVGLRDLIAERIGLFFRNYQGLETISSRLSPRLEISGCASFEEYYGLLCEETSASAAEWLYVVAALSKTKSSFARHSRLAQRLADTVIPQWLATNQHEHTLRIWSAGCSTGEEPLTIAMALDQAGWFDRIRIDLHASDANFVAIEKAKGGIYNQTRTKLLSPESRSTYFVESGESFRAKPDLHGRITWSVTNLMNESEIADLASSHIISCSNVFIYFSERAICQTLRLFGNLMPSGGYLSTDDGDYLISLMSWLNAFQREKISGVSIWRKAESTGPPARSRQ